MDFTRLEIRLANRDDQPGIISLIDGVYGEYGDEVCLAGAEADLLDLQAHYFDLGGAFWVLTGSNGLSNKVILGSHGALPGGESENACHFKRLYLTPELRGTQWGHELMKITIDWSRNAGFSRVEFWSDTRFHRAHRFFEKFGFKKDGRQREMHDGHEVYFEFFYSLDLC